jgi:hypothetical protein
MIDGISSQPFSARTLPPIEKPIVSFKKEILVNSRAMFARPRAEVEASVREWHGPSQSIRKVVTTTTSPSVVPATTSQKTEFVPQPRVVEKVERAVESVVGRPVEVTKASVGAPGVQRPAQVSTMSKPTIPKLQNNTFLKPSDVQNAVVRGDLKPVDTSVKIVKKDDAKGPKPENVNALRNALSSVLKDVKTAEENKSKLSEKKLESGPDQKKVENQDQTIKQPKKIDEVPEETLRKILDADQ